MTNKDTLQGKVINMNNLLSKKDIKISKMYNRLLTQKICNSSYNFTDIKIYFYIQIMYHVKESVFYKNLGMTIKTAETQQFQDKFLQALAVGQEPDIKCLKNWGKRHYSMVRALSFESKGPRFKS